MHVFLLRPKAVLASAGCLPYAIAPPGGTMHSTFSASFPDTWNVPEELNSVGKDTMVQVLKSALDCLLRKNAVSEKNETGLGCQDSTKNRSREEGV